MKSFQGTRSAVSKVSSMAESTRPRLPFIWRRLEGVEISLGASVTVSLAMR